MIALALLHTLALAGPPSASVVGGELAAEGAWPDAAAIYNSHIPYCSGVLVAPDLVLTAGHCERNLNSVRLDLIDLTTEAGVRREVAEHWVYPDPLTTLDVMLLRLSEPVDVPPRLLALDCLADHYIREKQPVVIVGYGATETDGSKYSDQLREAETTITDPICDTPGKDCNKSVVPTGELIAGGAGVDSCIRDSGGPLYARTPHGEFLVGLTSRGIQPASTTCGEGGIYVRADAVADWVEQRSGVSLQRPNCLALGLNQRPRPTAPTLVALDGIGGLQIDPGDADPTDSHLFEIIEPPTWGAATVTDQGWVQYTGPLQDTPTDSLTVRITDDAATPFSADLVIAVSLRPAPFEDPGGFSCAALPLFSTGWLALGPLLYTTRRRNRSRT